MSITEAAASPMVLTLNLVATFVFGLSGGLAGVRARLDLFGVVVLATVVAVAGGITRDVLIGVPPETFRDWRYLAAAGAAGLVCYFAGAAIERRQGTVLLFDAIGLALFCVTGATKALASGLGPGQAIILGALTGTGGSILRDVLLREIPIVLRSDLYAIPALAGAAVVAIADASGSDHGAYALAGAAVCLTIRLLGMRYQVSVPIAASERRRQPPSTERDDDRPS